MPSCTVLHQLDVPSEGSRRFQGGAHPAAGDDAPAACRTPDLCCEPTGEAPRNRAKELFGCNSIRATLHTAARRRLREKKDASTSRQRKGTRGPPRRRGGKCHGNATLDKGKLKKKNRRAAPWRAGPKGTLHVLIWTRLASLRNSWTPHNFFPPEPNEKGRCMDTVTVCTDYRRKGFG